MFGEKLKKLRKFGLDYCDLPTMLSNVAILLRVLTVNIEDNYKKGKIPKKYLPLEHRQSSSPLLQY